MSTETIVGALAVVDGIVLLVAGKKQEVAGQFNVTHDQWKPVVP